MKKIIVRIVIICLVIVVAAVVTCYLMLNSIVKKGVETFGPKVAGVSVKLEGVRLSPFSGKGEISGLVIGNPEGFKTPNAIQVSSASLIVQPSSLLTDKLVVRSVTIQGPEITFEGGLGNNNNLSKIMANIEAAAPAGKTTAPAGKPTPAAGETKPAKKIEVDDFIITGAKVHVSMAMMGSKPVTLPLPDIHLAGLGAGTNGMTTTELSQRIVQAITDSTLKAVGGAISSLGKGALDTSKNAAQGVTEGAGKAAKSITDLFKKK